MDFQGRMVFFSAIRLILSSYFRGGVVRIEGRSGWSGKAPAFAGGTGLQPVVDGWFIKQVDR